MSETAVPSQFYPELRRDYSNKIGSWGELAIYSSLDDYPIVPHFVNEPGVDIVIEGYSIGIEVWNHSRQHAYVQKLNSVIKNLSFNDFGFHVVSFISPEFKRIEESNGIKVIELGFQIIHPDYVSFYQKNYSMRGKKTLDKRTLKIIKNKLRPVIDTIEKCQTEEANHIRELSTNLTPIMINNHSHVCGTYNTSLNLQIIFSNHTSRSSISSQVINHNESKTETTENTSKSYGFEEPLPASNKADSKLRSMPILDCRVCTKRMFCDILRMANAARECRPRKFGVQDELLSYLEGKGPKPRIPFRAKFLEWAKRNSDLFEKQDKCSNRRAYLHLKLHIRQFEEKPD
jgi:hypothetical protein